MTTTLSLQSQLDTLIQSMDSIKGSIQQLEVQINKEQEAETFDVFVQNLIEPYFGESTSENIIRILQKCRRNNNNYHYFTGVYQWKSIHGNLEKRQLLKLISAVYRIKYINPLKNSTIASLRSDVKYAKACPECGKLALAFYDRLVSEGKIKHKTIN